MKVNDLVTRNKYNNDIIFRIIDIKEDKVIDRECTYNEYLGIE